MVMEVTEVTRKSVRPSTGERRRQSSWRESDRERNERSESPKAERASVLWTLLLTERASERERERGRAPPPPVSARNRSAAHWVSVHLTQRQRERESRAVNSGTDSHCAENTVKHAAHHVTGHVTVLTTLQPHLVFSYTSVWLNHNVFAWFYCLQGSV